MAGYITIARTEDIAPGRGREFQVNGRKVAVFNVDGEFFACDDECPHVGFSLAEGDVENGQVICFGHGWAFDLKTGECDRMPVEVDVFPVRVVDGMVQIAVEPQ